MKTRILHTKLWEDEWFCDLSEDGQKLFLYLITNRRINMCGMYECSDRVITFDAKLPPLRLEKAKAELAGKVYFFNGWVHVKNAQRLGGYKGTLCDSGIEKEISEVPENIKKCFIEGKCDIPTKPLEGVLESTEVAVSEPRDGWDEKTPAEQMQAFVNNEEGLFSKDDATPMQMPVQDIVRMWLMNTWKIDEMKATMEIGKFVSYWTEPMPSGKKVRWQTEKTFELKRRFIRWMSNNYGKAAAEGVNNNKYQASTV